MHSSFVLNDNERSNVAFKHCLTSTLTKYKALQFPLYERLKSNIMAQLFLSNAATLLKYTLEISWKETKGPLFYLM